MYKREDRIIQLNILSDSSAFGRCRRKRRRERIWGSQVLTAIDFTILVSSGSFPFRCHLVFPAREEENAFEEAKF